ncbi:hypothetical protein [uncultured Sphingomonas sp.]|uniref:hypothetical protein n=1 Tax=uncultured Sphingomonas sp. TaxID=158754 RepID=UPI002589B02A|nr:hypothetical protein [uncultured Sphingomonas sp.]
MTGWHVITDAAGAEIGRVFAMSDADLAANIPAGCAAVPADQFVAAEQEGAEHEGA